MCHKWLEFFSVVVSLHFHNNGRFNNLDCEELLIPADKNEIIEFSGNSSRNCQYHLELNLPTLQAHLPDKTTFEIIYNRSVLAYKN